MRDKQEEESRMISRFMAGATKERITSGIGGGKKHEKDSRKGEDNIDSCGKHPGGGI